jgi:hypothetical protein
MIIVRVVEKCERLAAMEFREALASDLKFKTCDHFFIRLRTVVQDVANIDVPVYHFEWLRANRTRSVCHAS